MYRCVSDLVRETGTGARSGRRCRAEGGRGGSRGSPTDLVLCPPPACLLACLLLEKSCRTHPCPVRQTGRSISSLVSQGITSSSNERCSSNRRPGLLPALCQTPPSLPHALHPPAMPSVLPVDRFTHINDLPFQRPLSLAPYLGTPSEGLPFPAALQVSGAELKTVEDVAVAFEELADKGEVNELLKKHGGALLIRGTHASTPEEFSRLVHALKLGKPHAEVRVIRFFSPLSSFSLP